MLKIALGTTSKWKISALENILKEIEFDAEIFAVEAASLVTPQPRTEKETRLGSINRAKNALKVEKDADIGLGIEVGYEPIDGTYFMHGVASIVDKSGDIYSEQSSTLELPKYFYEFLHDNEEDGVGFHVAEFEEKENDKTWKYFAKLIRYREPFIRESTRNVLLRYLFRKEY